MTQDGQRSGAPEPAEESRGGPGRAGAWLIAALIAAAVAVYVVLNWTAVSAPLGGILRALAR